ncbi:non-specific serine,threonine protein kinase [Sarracenia purpurea var. burkii]
MNIGKARPGGGGDDDADYDEESYDLFFALRTLQIATNFFSEPNQLSHGGFGSVYKVCFVRFLSRLCDCLEKRLSVGHDAGGEGDDDADYDEESCDLFFALRTLQIATNFFSELNQLSHGGFGPVYKVRFVNSPVIYTFFKLICSIFFSSLMCLI